MPRIRPSLFRQAKAHSTNLLRLLPACRDLESARNELRWLTEYALKIPAPVRQRRLAEFCRRRGLGFPLQYILGSQPFGDNEIKCRPGVLIPRPETEAYTQHLADLLKSGAQLHPHDDKLELNIIDICTGTGCIPIALFASLQKCFPRLNLLGVDIADEAVRLAWENIKENRERGTLPRCEAGQSLDIVKQDIFDGGDFENLTQRKCLVLISNPPYVSQSTWNYGRGQLGYSVRKYEPQLALVPNHSIAVPTGGAHEDVFYCRLLAIAQKLKPRIMLFEIGGEDQARRILTQILRSPDTQRSHVELWRDWPDLSPAQGEDDELVVALDNETARISIKGRGNIRSIFMNKE